MSSQNRLLLAVVTGFLLGSPWSVAQEHDHSKHAEHKTRAATPVNEKCPISGEEIEQGGPIVHHDGRTIGLCCDDCVADWNALTTGERTEHLKGVETAQGAEKSGFNELYVLDTCPVSGKKLGSMGDPVVERIGGREVRFCCSMCVAKFREESKQRFAEIDQKLRDEQRDLYPLDKCVVRGGKLGGMGEPAEIIHGNRLVRFCCSGCEPKFLKKPEEFIDVLDQAVKQSAIDAYSLKTCVVSGEELGSMGDPVNLVVAGRLIRLCCKSCAVDVRDAPARYLKVVDDARERSAGRDTGG